MSESENKEILKKMLHVMELEKAILKKNARDTKILFFLLLLMIIVAIYIKY